MKAKNVHSTVVDRLKQFVNGDMLNGEIDLVKPDTQLLDLGVLDSLSMLRLLSFIENEFDVWIADRDVMPGNFTTVNEIASLVLRYEESAGRIAETRNKFRQLINLQESYGLLSKDVTLPGGAQHHFLRSRGAEPSWVLLPGLGNPSIFWSPVMRTVDGEQSTYALDLGGFGLSDYGCQEGPSYFDHVDATVKLLEELDLGEVVLIGSSAGAMIACEICRRKPEWVKALVVTGFGLIEDPVDWWQRLQQLSKSPDEFLKAAYHAPPQLTPALSEILDQSLESKAYANFLNEKALAEMPATFDDLSLPVLFVAGQSDRIIPAQAVEAAAARVPGADIQWLARCGHFAPGEQPEAFLWYVKKFLRALQIDAEVARPAVKYRS